MPWKILILIVAAYVLYKLFINDARLKQNKGESKKQQERKVASGELVKDPVCGAYVSVEGAISVRDGEKVHRFCSYDCRDKFLEKLEGAGREIPQRHQDEDEE